MENNATIRTVISGIDRLNDITEYKIRPLYDPGDRSSVPEDKVRRQGWISRFPYTAMSFSGSIRIQSPRTGSLLS